MLLLEWLREQCNHPAQRVASAQPRPETAALGRKRLRSEKRRKETGKEKRAHRVGAHADVVLDLVHRRDDGHPGSSDQALEALR